MRSRPDTTRAATVLPAASFTLYVSLSYARVGEQQTGDATKFLPHKIAPIIVVHSGIWLLSSVARSRIGSLRRTLYQRDLFCFSYFHAGFWSAKARKLVQLKSFQCTTLCDCQPVRADWRWVLYNPYHSIVGGAEMRSANPWRKNCSQTRVPTSRRGTCSRTSLRVYCPAFLFRTKSCTTTGRIIAVDTIINIHPSTVYQCRIYEHRDRA